MAEKETVITKNNIQIVDDSPENLDILVAMLTKAGFEVRAAIDGATALASAREYPPDLILLDILMPGLSGFEVCKRLKADPATRHIPVVFISALHATGDKVRGLEAGGVDYITKPFDEKEVLARVRTHLEIKSARDALKEALREKEKARQLMTAIWQSIPDTVIAVDQDLVVIGSNRDFQSLCDIKSGLCGAPLDLPESPETCACRDALLLTLETRKPIREQQVKCLRGDKGIRIEVLNTQPLYDADKQFMGAVIVMRDITRMVRLEDALSERQRFGNIIGKSDAMQRVYRLLQQVSDIDINVLITGESGTGKELIAEALHFGSSRRDGPLIKVNCAALPDNLLQSELMGHVRGAFTGAVKERRGRIQAAEGGTLFLDEIGDISQRMQLQLLRFLESKEYEKVGETQTRKADVRVVAATNCDLREKIRQGAFRQDLYYRLIAIVFELPPLRKRTEDIPLLCDYFLRAFQMDNTKHIAGLSADVKRKLMAYSWPGNVRELKNTLEYACAVCPGEQIHTDDLPQYFLSALDDAPALKKVKHASHEETSEKDVILKMLDQVDWNKAKAARRLGVGRTTLYNKLKRYGIQRSETDLGEN